MHYAARQFHGREGHLTVPGKHVGTIDLDEEGQERQEVALEFGAWISDLRSRAASLTPERIGQLSRIGMRWT
ncbi:helicase associated domain-containing protein [Streptomyces bikiniensis]|uniref:helicase associated domain-containing protein n=1 Tax=Streptomyces bikiniensis TaxID=1896 RepID=UPI00068F4E9D|nr:helicase associated domain-containing protein [Streptomyces bikiniensis]